MICKKNIIILLIIIIVLVVIIMFYNNTHNNQNIEPNFIVTTNGLDYVDDYTKYATLMEEEGKKINYCSKVSDCNIFCVDNCPGAFILYNNNEDTNKFMDFYLKFRSESYKLNSGRPMCDDDFCNILKNLDVNITCENNMCKSYNSQCLND
jgi:c-di-AMP phosphodiesterase-like protein